MTGGACEAGIRRRLGAAHVWLLGCESPLPGLLSVCLDSLNVRTCWDVPLGGYPVRCLDVREVAGAVRRQGGLLCIDNSVVGCGGCAAVRLGADVVVEALGATLGTCAEKGLLENAYALGVSKRFLEVVPDAYDVVAALGSPLEGDAIGAAGDAFSAFEEYRHRAGDVAQVVANYLCCHPQVAKVWYPGLRGDAGFEVAARTLTGGFGPLVDFTLEKDGPAAGRGTGAQNLVPDAPGGRAGLSGGAVLTRLEGGLLRLSCTNVSERKLILQLETILSAASAPLPGV